MDKTKKINIRQLLKEKNEIDDIQRILSPIPLYRNHQDNLPIVKETLHNYESQIHIEIKKHINIDMTCDLETALRRSIYSNKKIAKAFYNFHLLLSDYVESNRRFSDDNDKRDYLLFKISQIYPNLEIKITSRDLKSKYRTTSKVVSAIFYTSPSTIERFRIDIKEDVIVHDYLLFSDTENINTGVDLLKRLEKVMEFVTEEIEKK